MSPNNLRFGIIGFIGVGLPVILLLWLTSADHLPAIGRFTEIIPSVMRRFSTHNPEKPAVRLLAPPPTRWVTDSENILSPKAVTHLEAELEEFHKLWDASILVYTEANLPEGASTSAYGAHAIQSWLVEGRREEHGVLLLICANNRTATLHVTRSLRGVFSDSTLHRLIQLELLPRLRRGTPDAAVAATVYLITGEFGSHREYLR